MDVSLLQKDTWATGSWCQKTLVHNCKSTHTKNCSCEPASEHEKKATTPHTTNPATTGMPPSLRIDNVRVGGMGGQRHRNLRQRQKQPPPHPRDEPPANLQNGAHLVFSKKNAPAIGWIGQREDLHVYNCPATMHKGILAFPQIVRMVCPSPPPSPID